MKKIIKNKLYDTDTANEVGYWDNGLYATDLDYCGETLFRKRTGEYFIHGDGGARSRYSVADGNGWRSGEQIVPLSYDAAREWAEKHLDADEYEAEFGPVSEDGGDAVVSARVSVAAKRALERESQRTGESQTAILERLLMTLAGE